MSNADWLLEVGVDTSVAKGTILEFEKFAQTHLSALGKNVNIRVNTATMTEQTQKAITQLKTSIRGIPNVNLNFNLTGASKSLNAFGTAINTHSGSIKNFTAMLEDLTIKAERSREVLSEQSVTLRESAEAIRTISNYLRNASENTQLATRANEIYTRSIESMNAANSKGRASVGNLSGSIRQAGNASIEAGGKHKTQEDALERLGKIVDNTIFKFVEYEVIMRGFNEVVHGFTSSITEASNVQFEQTLQRLYAPTMNINSALKDAIIIAKEYGSDITDVQQAIGLWSKITGDQASATYLAIEAEKMHRVSGIDTLEVFKDSVAVLQQMGLAGKDLPGVYDQITEAALKLAEPLKSMGKGGQEGMKDIMEGLSRFGAQGKSFGLDTAGVIAMVSAQIQTMAEGGHIAGASLSNLFGSMDNGGITKGNFDKIMGPDTFKGPDGYEKTLRIMTQLEKKAPELAEAISKGDVKMKASVTEVEHSLQASIKNTIETFKDLEKNSKGKLDFLSDAELKTYQGRMDQLKASTQAFSLQFGQQMLPGMTSFVIMLSQQFVPWLTRSTGFLMQLGQAAAYAGGALLSMQIVARIGAALQAFQVSAWAAAGASEALRVAEVNRGVAQIAAVGAGWDNVAAMEAARAEAGRLALAEAALMEAFTAFGVACGASGAELATFVAAELAAASESGLLTVALDGVATAEAAVITTTNAFIFEIGGIAIAALSTVAPLAILAAGIWGVTNAMQGMSQAGAADVTLDIMKNQASQKGMNFGQRFWSNITKNPIGTAAEGFKVMGATKAGMDPNSGVMQHYVMDYLNNISQNNSQIGLQVKDALGRLKSGKDQPGSPGFDRDWDVLHVAEAARTSKAPRNAANAQDMKALMAQIMDDIKKNQPPGFNNPRSKPEASPPGSLPNKGESSAESLMMGDIQRSQKNFQALASEYRDTASAAKEYADAIKATTEATGIGKNDVKDYTQALSDQVKAMKEERDTRAAEIASMKSKQGAAQADVNATKAGTPAHEHAKNNLAQIQSYIEKTTGAYNLLNRQIQLAVANNNNLIASMQLMQDEQRLGIDNYKEQVEDVKRKVSTSSGYADTISSIGSGRSILEAGLKKANQAAIDPAIGGNRAALKEANDMVRAYKEALDALGKSEVEITDKSVAFGESLKTIKDNVYAENTADIGKALGIDTGSMDALNTQIEMYKKMAEEIKSAGEDYKNSEKTPQDTANYNNLLNEIRERQQLAPILEQEAKLKADIKKTEDSSTFKMVNEQVKNFGDKAIDNITKPLGKGFGGSLITGALKDTWATASKSITDNMFGIDKEKEKETTLQSIYKDHVTGLQKAADDLKATVDTLLAGLGDNPLGGSIPQGISSGSFPGSEAGTLASADSSSDNPFLRAINGTDSNHADDSLAALQDIKANTAPPSDTSAAAHYADYPNIGDLSSSAGIGGAPADGIPVKIASIASGGASSAASVVIPGVSSALGGVMKDAGLGGSTNPFSALISGGMPALSKNLSGGISKIMGNGGLTMGDIGLGIGVGDLAGTLFGGGSHTTNGEMGGALGSGLGALGTALGIFGPGGAILGALAGGVLGGMFGHKDDPAKMPDKFDSNFAQETANLTGKSYTSEASGQQFMSANVAGSTAGQGEISSIEELLAKYPNPQDAPAWLQPYYTQAMSTFGASSTGSGVLKFGTDIANEHIAGAAGASQTDQNYQGINSLADQIEQAQALHTNQAQAPILSINAYGSNGAYGNSIYNTPGLTSDQFNAMQTNGFANSNLNNYYATPGVGTSTAGVNTNRNLESYGTASGLLGNMTLTTNLVVDGKTLATVVNAANAATASRTSTS